MKYDKLTKDELVLKIKKLELDLINSKSINKKSEKAEEMAKQQRLILKFLNSMAIPSADKSTVEEFSKILLQAVKDYTGAILATFSYYQSDKKELVLLHIEAEQDILKKAMKIAGEKIVKTATPVDDETYKLMTKEIAGKYNTFTEVTFGAIPSLIDKAIRASTGIDRLYPVAHVIEGELYGTTLLAFKKGQASPSIELLETYANLMTVSLRRYNAEKALTESEAKYKDLFVRMMNAFALHEMIFNEKGEPADYKFLEVNPSWEKIVGIKAEKVIGKTIREIMPDIEDSWLQTYGRVVKTGISEEFEDYNKATQKYYHIYTYSTGSGKFAVLFNDITKHKLAQIELLKAKEIAEESEQRLMLASSSGKLGIWDWNVKENRMVWDERMFELYGIKKETFINSIDAWLNGLHPEDKERAISESNEALVGGKHFNTVFRVLHPDGKVLYIKGDGLVLRDSSGKAERMIGVNRNITKSKLAELELLYAKEKAEESKERWENLFNNSPDAIAVYKAVDNGKDFCFTDINLKAQEIDKISRDQIIEKRISEAFPTAVELGFIDVFKRVWESGKTERMDVTFYKDDRIDGWRENIIYKLNSGEIVAIYNDVTEFKKAEQALIKAKEKAEESDRLKSAFLANMSHEIRTPMNGILGFAEILKEPNLTTDKQREYLTIIEKSGARMLNIINDIVDISKIESGQMKVSVSLTNVNEQIEFMYSFFKSEVEQKGIRLSIKNSLPSTEALIRTDREKLFAILTNLIKNAIKFTRTGSIEIGYVLANAPTGNVESVFEPGSPDQIRSGRELEFFVKDSGIGVPVNRQQAIFERFIQAEISDKMARQGAGLGLAISKAYVEMLGGKIWVESEKGKGSTFYFTLSDNLETNDKNIAKDDNLLTLNVEGMKNKIVLIAEDDESSEALISLIVQKLAIEIINVRTGTAAVEACRNNHDIDLVLMDIQMPEMDGYEATRQIRKFNPELVIIAQTAYALSGDREKAIDAGCTDYISKPIRKDALTQIIQKYL